MSADEYTIADLFCGGGGFSLGFDQPERLNGLGQLEYHNIGFGKKRFKTVYAVDNYEHAVNTIGNNFDCEVDHSPIQDISDFTQYNDCDVVIGGPPCQGFSQLNSKKTADLDDDRNELWRQYMLAVLDIKPDVFVVENVPRFLDSTAGRGLVEMAEEHGYNTTVGVLNTADYGVPQYRKRAFVVGSRVGVPFLPAPTTEQERTVRDAIGDLPRNPTNENLHDGRNFGKLTRDRMRSVPRDGNRKDIPRYLLPKCWKDYNGSGTDLFGRLDWNSPAVTIRTSFHKPMKGRHLHPEPGSERTITLREGARLQTFPDDFEFGTNYQVHIARLIGNAVPPKLSYHIAEAVKCHLEGLDGTLMSEQESEYDDFNQSHLVDCSQDSEQLDEQQRGSTRVLTEGS